ncbi:MAG: glucose-6-phosphate isomerase, partial [Desulfitobacterium hafniense]
MVIITSWKRFKEYLYYDQELELLLDISRMNFSAEFLTEMAEPMRDAYHQLQLLEKGALANPDEGRMVGHYWLRNPDLAPTEEIAQDIKETLKEILDFAEQIHSGRLQGEKGNPFRNILLVGVGGSILGPRFVADALASSRDKMKAFFIDNGDPDGIDRVLSRIGEELPATLCIIISKSGGTIETRNG